MAAFFILCGGLILVAIRIHNALERNRAMEPISAALTGLALARQGIAFIKENIESAE